ncbi:hypothetical protein SPFM12_00281 [Salmonella phage SPFM12]|nr:hypothetical protein SPFM12_00281 [Salmonella phage SPFM12]
MDSMQNQFLIEADEDDEEGIPFMSSTDVDRVEHGMVLHNELILPVDETEMKLALQFRPDNGFSDRVIKMANGDFDGDQFQVRIQTLYIDEVVTDVNQCSLRIPGGLGIMVIPLRNPTLVQLSAAMQYDPLVDEIFKELIRESENKLLRRGYSSRQCERIVANDAWKLKAPWRWMVGLMSTHMGSTHIPFGGRATISPISEPHHMDFRRESMEGKPGDYRAKLIEPRFLISRALKANRQLTYLFTGAIDAVKNIALLYTRRKAISSKLIVTEEGRRGVMVDPVQWKELFETQRHAFFPRHLPLWKEIFAPNRHNAAEGERLRFLRNLVDNHVSIFNILTTPEADGKRAHAVKRVLEEHGFVRGERGNDLMMWMIDPYYRIEEPMFNAFFNSKLKKFERNKVTIDVWLRAPDEMGNFVNPRFWANLGCKCPTCGYVVTEHRIESELNSAPICSLDCPAPIAHR